MAEPTQTYATHGRYIPVYHFFAVPVLVAAALSDTIGTARVIGGLGALLLGGGFAIIVASRPTHAVEPRPR